MGNYTDKSYDLRELENINCEICVLLSHEHIQTPANLIY